MSPLLLAVSLSRFTLAVCNPINCPAAQGCDQQAGSALDNGENALLGYDVNPGTGNLFLVYHDFDVIPALGPIIGFNRYYNSQGFNNSVGFGQGWTHSFSWMTVVNANTVKVITESGRAILFTANGANWTPQAGEFGTLVGIPSNGVIYTTKYGTAYAFDANGRLVSITPANNTAITVQYLAGGKINKVVSGNLSLTFGYNGAFISSVTDPAGNVISYGYLGGFLTNVTQPNVDSGGTHGQVKYNYASVTVNGVVFSAGTCAAQLTQVQQLQTSAGLGGTWQTTGLFSYTNPVAGSTQVVHAAAGTIGGAFLREVSLTYSLCSNVLSSTVASMNGGTKTITSTQVSGFQRLTNVVATSGIGESNEWASGSVTYNADLTLATVTDGNNIIRKYAAYDLRGNPTSFIDAFGTASARTTTMTYHPVLARPLSVTRASVDGIPNHVHQLIVDYDNDYNANYNQHPTNYIHQVVETGYTDTMLAGAANQQVTYTTHFTFDASNRITQKSGPLPNESVSFTYWGPGNGNATNRLKTMVVATGAATSLTTTYNAFDANGRVLEQTDPNGTVYDTTLGSMGEVKTDKVTSGATQETESYEYDLAGNRLTDTKPGGTKVKWEWDSAGRLWRMHAEAANGAVPWSIVNDYDGWNRQVTYRRFSGLGADPGAGCTAMGTEEYCRERSWDKFGRVSSVRFLDSTNAVCAGNDCTVSFNYDANGNISSTVEGGLNTTSYSRDALNRLNRVTLPGGRFSTMGYDINDKLISRRDPRDVNNGGGGGAGRLTTWVYDDMGRQIAMSPPDTGLQITNFDAEGNTTTSKDAVGNQLSFMFDAASRRVEIHSPAPNQDVFFVYDEAGMIGGKNYANTKGRLTSVQSLDPSGNKIYSHYSYDLRGRVIADIEERGGAMNTTYATTTYQYGPSGELQLMSYPDAMLIQFKFPAAGGFAPTPLPSELDVSYNGGNPAVASNIGYFGDGLVSGLTFGNGSTRSMTRNRRDEPTRIVSGPAAAPVLDQRYGYDAHGLGLLTGVNHFQGQANAWNWTFTYDALDRVQTYATNVRPIADNYSWAYDEVGNRASQTYNGGAPVPYSYDAAKNTSRVASVGSTPPTAWTYDGNGSVATYNGNSANAFPYVAYTYDSLGHMSSIVNHLNANQSVTIEGYQYYGQSNRWQKADASGNWTQFYYDTSGRITQEYAYNGVQVNGDKAYAITDHVYLGPGASEIARIMRSFQRTCPGCNYGFVDQDIQYVHEDEHGSAFAIESASSGGLAWAAETGPFADVLHVGLPGVDKKIGTADDGAATTSNFLNMPFTRPTIAGSLAEEGSVYRDTEGEFNTGPGPSYRAAIHGFSRPLPSTVKSSAGASAYAGNGMGGLLANHRSANTEENSNRGVSAGIDQFQLLRTSLGVVLDKSGPTRAGMPVTDSFNNDDTCGDFFAVLGFIGQLVNLVAPGIGGAAAAAIAGAGGKSCGHDVGNWIGCHIFFGWWGCPPTCVGDCCENCPLPNPFANAPGGGLLGAEMLTNCTADCECQSTPLVPSDKAGLPPLPTFMLVGECLQHRFDDCSFGHCVCKLKGTQVTNPRAVAQCMKEVFPW